MVGHHLFMEDVMYVDTVKRKDMTDREEMRDWRERTVKDGMVAWAWGDCTVMIPIHNILEIVTTEE